MITDYQLAQNLHKRHVKLLERGQRNRLEYGAMFEHFYSPDREPALFRLLNPAYNDIEKAVAWQRYLEDSGISLIGKSLQWSSELASVYRVYIQQRGLAHVQPDYSLFGYAPILLRMPIYMLLKLRSYLPDGKQETIELLEDIRERCPNRVSFEILLATELRPPSQSPTTESVVSVGIKLPKLFTKETNASGAMIHKAFSHLPLGTLSEIEPNAEYLIRVSFEKISVPMGV